MKSFNQFISESINIAGDFNGNLYVNGSDNQPEAVGESFIADVYPQTNSSLKIKNSQRYQPERLTWTD